MKKILRIISLFIFLVAVFCLNSKQADAASDILKDNENGVLTITYDNTDNAKMKIAVAKDGKSYYYNLKNGKNALDIPLTMGNGTYNIRICKNLTGTKYSVLQSEEFDLELTNEDEVYLHSNIIVDYEVKDKAIDKAADLTKKSKTEADKIKKIYDYVVKNYLYDYEKIESLTSGYIPDINIIYKNKKGICYDISAITAAMMRSQGIYVKLVTGYTPNVKVYHAWNVIYDKEKDEWYTVDATYDLCLYVAGKKYKMKKTASDYTDITYQY